jgi:hypothetical protein
MAYRLREGSLTSNRIASLDARVVLLERAQSHPSLTRRERRLLRASIRWQRSSLLGEIEERPVGPHSPPSLDATAPGSIPFASARLGLKDCDGPAAAGGAGRLRLRLNGLGSGFHTRR